MHLFSSKHYRLFFCLNFLGDEGKLMSTYFGKNTTFQEYYQLDLDIMARFYSLNRIHFGLVCLYCFDSALIHRHLRFSAFTAGSMLGE